MCMKTSSAKAKGRRACAALREKLLTAAPDLQPGDIGVTPSGVTGADLYLSPAALKTYPLAFECKNTETLNIWAALKQSEQHVAGTDLKPVVCFTRNRAGTEYVALKLDDFLWLIR